MTETHPGSELDQPRSLGRERGIGGDPELLGCAPQQGGVADRFGCRGREQPLRLGRKRPKLPVEVLFDAVRERQREIAAAMGRSEAACRQLAVQARRHMDAGRPRFEAGRKEREELAGRFLGAFRDGDVVGLRELLAADVQLVGDGGRAPQWADRFTGAEDVARVLAALVRLFARIGGVVEPREVNGQPGAIFRDRDGKVLTAWALDILDGQIQTVRTVNNPDKLRHLGPVADAWAALREATQARRPAH